METTKQCQSSTDELLKFFDSLPKKNESDISEDDVTFCENQQRLLYETLDKIHHWYSIFREEAVQYETTCSLTYKTDGSVNYHRNYCNDSDISVYKKFEFKPFDVINSLVKERNNAIHLFPQKIIEHFNKKYSVLIPSLPDDEKVSLDFRPDYTKVINHIKNHLQGKGFQKIAVEEILQGFHNIVEVSKYRSKKVPYIVKNKIMFPSILVLEESYYHSLNTYKILNYSNELLKTLCKGIQYGSSGKLNGDSSLIQNFNYLDVDTEYLYAMNIDSVTGIKFYKNGRVDICFDNAITAKICFERLKLNELTNNNN